VGAHVGELPHRGRTRAGAGEIEDRVAFEWLWHQGFSAGRMGAPACEAGLRRVHFPASTAVTKSSTARLNASGSSRLIVWPDFGRTTSPAVGILRFMKIPGSRHGSSSSPVIVNIRHARVASAL